MVRAPPLDVVRLRVMYSTLRLLYPVRVLNQGHVFSRHGAVRHSYWMGRSKGVGEAYVHQVDFHLAEPHQLEKHKGRIKSLVTGERNTTGHVTA